MTLSGKRIVLTGATSGIGRKLADRLSRDNELTALGRPSARSEDLVAAHPSIVFIETDLAEKADLENACKSILANGRELHGLINCAAVQNTPRLTENEFDLDAMYREIAVNFTAICHLSACLLPALLKADEAFVLNVNSGLGLVPKTESAVYCATKGAMDIFSKALRNQMEGSGVAVLQAFLPLVDTPMTQGRGSGKLDAADIADAILRGVERRVEDNDIGKVKLLRAINRVSPRLARSIMKRG